MGQIVRLDTSAWPADAQARMAGWDEQLAAWREEAKARADGKAALEAAKREHPFAGALDDVSWQSMLASLRPVIKTKVIDFGNGHKEACMWRHVPDPHKSLDRAIERDLKALAPRGESEDREANIARATRRRKQQVRHWCKAAAVNSLWTLTYRENVQDRDLVLRHVAQFRRRVLDVLPGWKYLWVIERQERGALHVHLATHELAPKITLKGIQFKSWDLMRSIWRSVVGDLGGNFDEAKRKRRWSNRQKRITGSGAIASYIAGYVAKDMADTAVNKKGYAHSTGEEIPQALREVLPGDTPVLDVMRKLYSMVGDNITRRWFDPVSGVFFIESDDSVQLRSG